MSKLIIFGANSLAKLAHFYATNELGMDVLGFAVDESYKEMDKFESLPVFVWPELKERFSPDEVSVFVAIGYKSMRAREAVYTKLKASGFQLINLVCSSSYMAKNVSIGNNNFIMPGAVIEPDVKMGDNNVVWSNATVCHDSIIGDHNFFAANVTIGGAVSIGNQNFIGFSSVVHQHIRIGNETLIGSQSLVNRDTQDLSFYRGSPAIKVSPIDPRIGVKVN